MISLQDDQIRVEGDFNQQTIPALIAQGEDMVRAGAGVINLAAVDAVDSSAVAAVLGWMRLARASGRELRVTAAPAAFRSLSDLYGVSGFIFQESDDSNRAGV
ncbi:lipid asymmetry maintenance protein MlaB [Uliginosibacterium paludis]|uniref:STAS domain-containing protein n=1 Tax=Uliginosibacterium paludis TaxID=1615952 RepID=A0ABV2CQ33_9RHOO